MNLGQVISACRRLNSAAYFLRRILNILFVLNLIFGLAGVTDAGEDDSGALTASLDQETVPVGGVVSLVLDYQLPAGSRLPAEVEVGGLDGVSVLNQTIDPRQVRIQLLVDRTDESWQSGPIRLAYLDSTGDTQYLTTQPVSIQLVSNISDNGGTAELRPIRDIVSLESIWQRYQWWLAGMAALALIGLGLFWWYKKFKRSAIQSEYKEPPEIRARRELRTLEAQRFFENGMVKRYYFVYSEILRRYLESIRHFPAAESTTEEIVRHITIEQDRKLIPLLQQADLVKFADTVPTRARKEADIKAALDYIRATSPRLDPVQEKTAPRKEVRP